MNRRKFFSFAVAVPVVAIGVANAATPITTAVAEIESCGPNLALDAEAIDNYGHRIWLDWAQNTINEQRSMALDRLNSRRL